MGTAIDNPLYAIRVGSIVGDSGTYGDTVLKPGLTTFNPQKSGVSFMTGNSSYVYSEHMNQASLSASGSFGLSGLSKVSVAIAGYVGHTAAASGNTLSINLNLIKWAGVEHVHFNAINPAELLAALEPSAHAAAMEVLERFGEMQKVQHETGKEAEKEKARLAWMDALERFRADFGTGLVVGVCWGGWGAVNLTFQATSEQTKWQVAVDAKFSYASAAVAVDVAATYGHAEDSIGKTATAAVSSMFNGACVEGEIKAWERDLQAKANSLTTLGKEPVIRSTAKSGSLPSPKFPDFHKPKAEKKITDLVSGIRDVKGLETYAMASAFEKQKDDKDGIKDLGEFIKAAKKPNKVDKIPKGAVSPLSNEESPVIVLGNPADAADAIDDVGSGVDADAGAPALGLSAEETGGDHHGTSAPSGEPDHGSAGSEPAAAGDLSNYEPLGIWTLQWGQLFPWCVSARDNRVPADARFRDWIRLKTMHQDFLSLSRLYERLDASGATFTFGGEPLNWHQIANAFSKGASDITDFIVASQGEADRKINDKILELNNGLGAVPRRIYKTWDSVACLRDCELGVGIVFTRWNPDQLSGGGSWGSDEPGPERRIVPGGPQPALTLGSITAVEGRGQLNAVHSAFEPQGGNFFTFSDAVKGWPFVLPDGRVAVFVCDGRKETSGILAGRYSDRIGACTTMRLAVDAVHDTHQHSKYFEGKEQVEFYDQGDGRALNFENRTSMLRGYTFSDKHVVTTVDLYPIPFSAASGVDWKGSSLTTGMGALPGTLKLLRDQLSRLPAWSFDSDHWSKVDWKTFRYSMHLPAAYIGLVDEPPNVFLRDGPPH
jgi:hypothetical protein